MSSIIGKGPAKRERGGGLRHIGEIVCKLIELWSPRRPRRSTAIDLPTTAVRLLDDLARESLATAETASHIAALIEEAMGKLGERRP